MIPAPDDEVPLEDLPARPTAPSGSAADSSMPRPSPDQSEDDIIPIEDLAPRTNVKGGRSS